MSREETSPAPLIRYHDFPFPCKAPSGTRRCRYNFEMAKGSLQDVGWWTILHLRWFIYSHRWSLDEQVLFRAELQSFLDSSVQIELVTGLRKHELASTWLLKTSIWRKNRQCKLPLRQFCHVKLSYFNLAAVTGSVWAHGLTRHYQTRWCSACQSACWENALYVCSSRSWSQLDWCIHKLESSLRYPEL